MKIFLQNNKMKMKKQVTISVSFPRLQVNVDYVGSNSLLGALCKKLIEKDLMKNIGVLDPEEIVFIIYLYFFRFIHINPSNWEYGEAHNVIWAIYSTDLHKSKVIVLLIGHYP